MKLKIGAILFNILCLFPLSAQANSNIFIQQPYARAMAPSATTSAVFGNFVNQSNQAISIIAANTPVAGKVELHEVIKQGDMMKMRQVSEIELPTNETTQLKPGGLHIMLFDLKHRLQQGENIAITITLKNGNLYTFTAPVTKVMTGMKKHAHH